MGKLVSIVHTPAGIDPRPPDHYARLPLAVAVLEAGRGIVTDRKGGKVEDRQLNIMAAHTLEELRGEGYKTAPGEMGEQLVVAELDVNRLPTGARLQVGVEVVVEVDKPRTGCERLRAIQGCSPADVAGRLGVMARVLKGGTIRVGDAVTLLTAGAT